MNMKQKKTKCLWIILAFACMLFSVLGAVSMAESGADMATIHTTAAEAAPGGTFTVTVYAETDTLVDFQLALTYDSKTVEFVSAEAASSNACVTPWENNRIHISFTNVDSNLTERTAFATLTFRIADSVAPGTVDEETKTLTSYPFLSFDTEYMAASAEANRLTEDKTFSPVTLQGDFGAVTVYPFGDVNKNGGVSINDITYLRQYLVSTRELDDAQLGVADVYAEGAGETADEHGLSLCDALWLQRSLGDSSIVLDTRNQHKHTYTCTALTEPTCATDGSAAYACTSCDDTYTEVLPATHMHKLDGDECSVCNRNLASCKHETKTYTVSLLAYGLCGGTLEVSVCDCGRTRTLVAEHVFCTLTHDEELDIGDKTTKNGSYSVTYTCSDCKLKRVETTTVGAIFDNESGSGTGGYTSVTEVSYFADGKLLFSYKQNPVIHPAE